MTDLASVSTPALVVDVAAFDQNLRTMSAARPGATLRPHVKAHKCTSLAARQAELGHTAFTCATPREVIGMAHAGLGNDLLLANQSVDATRLSAMAKLDGSMVTVAVDSTETVDAAARAGIRHVLIDVNVGLPRCGCRPEDAAALAESCRQRGLNVRGVMGYEGHLMAMTDRSDQRTKVRTSMITLVETFDAVRAVTGENCTIVSAGGTGTFDLYDASDPTLARVNEVQAGSYALMDAQYGSQGLPFLQAVFVIGTVISRSNGWFVADVGLKSLGMDHGNPTIPGASVWFCSDEHVTFSLRENMPTLAIGDRVVVVPAHVDPTVSQHEQMSIVEGRIDHGSRMEAQVVDTWAVDLRGW
jgi:D-serine deaminase-like pyridoxal phosphate-dependent protein